MPNNNYLSGRRLEHVARAQLRRNGYEVVRSAGSKGKVDLVAWDENCIKLIQIKADGAATKAHLQELKTVICPPCGSVELWERDTNSFTGWKVTVVASKLAGLSVTEPTPKIQGKFEGEIFLKTRRPGRNLVNKASISHA